MFDFLDSEWILVFFRSPSSLSKQQLIPGSILIDDPGDIDSSTWKGTDTRLNSLASNNSFNPGGRYVSDEAGGQGGFLAPIHNFASSIIPSPAFTGQSEDDLGLKRSTSTPDASIQSSSILDDHSDISNKTEKERKPWVNPYWTTLAASDKNAGAEKKIISTSSAQSRALSEESSSRNRTPSPRSFGTKSPSEGDQNKTPWSNPYWDAKPISKSPSNTPDPVSITALATSWENPYWKGNKQQALTASVDEQKAEDTGSRKDTKSPIASLLEQNAKQWENPYWKDNKQPALAASVSQQKAEDTSSRQDNKSTVVSSLEQTAKQWENPYWKNSKSPEASSPQPNAKQWENPYWKDNKQPALAASIGQQKAEDTSSRQDTKSPGASSPEQTVKQWENPYWKDNKQPASAASIGQQKVEDTGSRKDTKSPGASSPQPNVKQWENPYWKNSKSTVASTLEQTAKQWENPYWKDNKQPALAPSIGQQKVEDTGSRKDTKSPGASSLEQDTKQWENPYWKGDKSQVLTASVGPQKVQDTGSRQDTKSPAATSLEKSTKTWENPYWKDTKSTVASSVEQTAKQWENPYWKGDKPQVLTALVSQKKAEDADSRENTKSPVASSSTENSKPWENPYWKGKKSQAASSAKKQDGPSRIGYENVTTLPNSRPTEKDAKPWENPYWKDNKSPSTTTTPVKKEPWKNPYWQDNKSAVTTSSKTPDRPWENPYWKDHKSSSATTTPTKTEQWKNPYWKEIKTAVIIASKHSDKPWVNPYWKEKPSSPRASSSQPTNASTELRRQESKPRTSSVTKENAKPWINPYWKDHPSAGSSAEKKTDQPWENPYWKKKTPDSSNKPQSTISALPQTTPWVNPYWPDKKAQAPSKSDQFSQNQNTNGDTRPKTSPTSHGSKTRTKGNASDTRLDSSKRSSSQHSLPSIPAFYERIYPPSETAGSSKRSSKTQRSTKYFQQVSSQVPYPPTTGGLTNIADLSSDDQDALPFTIDNRGVLHFRAESSASPASPFKLPNFTTSSPRTQSQAHIPSPSVRSPIATSHAAPYPAGIPAASSTSKLANLTPVEILNSLSSASSFVVITEREISDIQNALRLLEKNPNSIPTVEASQLAAKTSSNTQNRPYPTTNTTFNNSNSQPIPPYSQNAPSNPSSYPANYSTLSQLVNPSLSNQSSTFNNNIPDYPSK